MSEILPRRLVVLPGPVEGHEPLPSPEETVGLVLGANPHAPGLLSEARYRVVEARNTVTAATEAARTCRNAEIGYEQAHRAHDPESARNLHFWAAAAMIAGLAVVSCVIVVVMAWHLPLLHGIVLAIAATVLGAAVAYGASRRKEAAAWFGLVGLGMCAALVVLSVLWSAAPLLLRTAEAVAFGIALAAAGVGAVLVLERAEGWCCYRPRRAYRRAARRRQHLATRVSRDEATAEAAVNAWVSLVVEECQLASSGDAGDMPWVQVCADTARQVAIPT